MVVGEGQRANVGKGLMGERVVMGKELMACRGRRVWPSLQKINGVDFHSRTQPSNANLYNYSYVSCIAHVDKLQRCAQLREYFYILLCTRHIF